MKTVTVKVLLGAAMFLLGFAACSLWRYVGERVSEPYRERNVPWDVSGIIVDAMTKKPLPNVDLDVFCAEALTSDHKRGAPFYRTNFVMKATEDGSFRVQFFGGSIQVFITAEGFDETMWMASTRGGRTVTTTNIVVELKPDRKALDQ